MVNNSYDNSFDPTSKIESPSNPENPIEKEPISIALTQKQLFHKTLTRWCCFANIDLRASKSMYDRVWYLHIFVSMIRCLEIIFGTGVWFGNQTSCLPASLKSCTTEYEENMMESTKHYCKYALEVFVFFGVFLDALCIKWRQIAHFFIYLELICRLVAVMIPSAYSQQQDEFGSLMTFGAIFLAFFCGESISIVANSLTLGFHITWVKLVYCP